MDNRCDQLNDDLPRSRSCLSADALHRMRRLLHYQRNIVGASEKKASAAYRDGEEEATLDVSFSLLRRLSQNGNFEDCSEIEYNLFDSN